MLVMVVVVVAATVVQIVQITTNDMIDKPENNYCNVEIKNGHIRYLK